MAARRPKGVNKGEVSSGAAVGHAPIDGEKKKKKRPWRQAVRRKAKRATKEDILGGAVEVPQAEASVPAAVEDSPPSENALESKLCSSQFRILNEQLYSCRSADAESLFSENPHAFQVYHKGYELQVRKWPHNPLDRVIADLSKLPKGTVVADMGCGNAGLARKLGDKLTVLSFDLVAANSLVTACNITRTPLPDASVDVAVYCLSLMGTNLGDFFREANRILKKGGTLKIAEVLSRFRHVKNFIRAVGQMGFELKKKSECSGFFLMMTFKKVDKVKQKRPTGLILEPCLYKRR